MYKIYNIIILYLGDIIKEILVYLCILIIFLIVEKNDYCLNNC